MGVQQELAFSSIEAKKRKTDWPSVVPGKAADV